MSARALPSQDLLLEILEYDCESGLLFWKFRPRRMFTSDRAWKCWNVRFSGKEALSYIGGNGYKVGDIQRRKFIAHRVIWKLVHGSDPLQIDHINGVKIDNRLINLRNVTPAENNKNHPMKRRNKSGCIGVRWYPRTSSWQASIRCDGKYEFLGYFKTIEEAAVARRKAEDRLGFHPNHGRSAVPERPRDPEQGALI